MFQSDSSSIENERRIMAKIKNPFVINLIDPFYTDLNFAIVMDYFEVSQAQAHVCIYFFLNFVLM